MSRISNAIICMILGACIVGSWYLCVWSWIQLFYTTRIGAAIIWFMASVLLTGLAAVVSFISLAILGDL